mmetsp:Transcript_8943/g.15792  ORF Transcript_8943/g.15792 Transcript_8943/m.15792 type:complete len:93 (+) Transcript_8943:755-1033(+)
MELHENADSNKLHSSWRHLQVPDYPAQRDNLGQACLGAWNLLARGLSGCRCVLQSFASSRSEWSRALPSSMSDKRKSTYASPAKTEAAAEEA